MPARLTPERLSRRAQDPGARDQAHDEEHQKHEEQHARDARGGDRDSSESEHAGDQRDDEEHESPVEHLDSLRWLATNDRRVSKRHAAPGWDSVAARRAQASGDFYKAARSRRRPPGLAVEIPEARVTTGPIRVARMLLE